MKKFIAIVALMGALSFSNHATAGVHGGFRGGHFGHTVFFYGGYPNYDGYAGCPSYATCPPYCYYGPGGFYGGYYPGFIGFGGFRDGGFRRGGFGRGGFGHGGHGGHR